MAAGRGANNGDDDDDDDKDVVACDEAGRTLAAGLAKGRSVVAARPVALVAAGLEGDAMKEVREKWAGDVATGMASKAASRGERTDVGVPLARAFTWLGDTTLEAAAAAAAWAWVARGGCGVVVAARSDGEVGVAEWMLW